MYDPEEEEFDARVSDPGPSFPPLPDWLARRLLRSGETITWVRGPRFNPSAERYLTHPVLAVFALVVGAAGIGAARLIGAIVHDDGLFTGLAILTAAALVVGSIIVLAFACGYFTRLVVTDRRLVIIQGYEVCHAWDISDLPRHLLRYGRRGMEMESPTIDLEAVKTMLGGSSDKFTESKTILAFGKQLNQIKKGHPNERP